MATMQRFLLGAAALALAFPIGCTCGAEQADEPAREQREPPVAETAAPTPPAPQARTSTPPVEAPARPSDEERALRRASSRALLRRALRTARRLSREGRDADALAELERALAQASATPRVLCETAYIAHRAHREERARELVRRALADLETEVVPDALRVPTAMCLYNASLIYEASAEGDHDGVLLDALYALRRSAELRPNATVEARMSALRARLAAAGVDVDVDARWAPGVTMEAVLEELRAGLSEEASVERRAPERAAGIPDALFEALIVLVRDGDHVETWLVLRDGAGARAGRLDEGYGAGPDVLVEWRDLVPGGHAELYATVTTGGDWSASSTSYACADAWTCVDLWVDRASWDGPCEFVDDPEECADPENHVDSGYTLAEHLEPGAVVLELVHSFLEPEHPPPGRYLWADLFAQARAGEEGSLAWSPDPLRP